MALQHTPPHAQRRRMAFFKRSVPAAVFGLLIAAPPDSTPLTRLKSILPNRQIELVRVCVCMMCEEFRLFYHTCALRWTYFLEHVEPAECGHSFGLTLKCTELI